MKSGADLEALIERIEYPGYRIITEWAGCAQGGQPLYNLRVLCDEGFCNVTGKRLIWKGRKFILSQNMTDGEVVQTAFMAVMTANEHETREKFKYRGVTVFDPHYDIEKLVELRSSPDAISERA